MTNSLSNKIYAYYKKKWKLAALPNDVQWINPFEQKETLAAFKSFHDKYYSDNSKRIYLLGINPGRHGAGVTGVAFTDPIKLSERCGIDHNFKMRRELSSQFVYEVIEAYGGEDLFYGDFAISSVCPLGFTRHGKNYNYYDDSELYKAVRPVIDKHLLSLSKMGARQHAVISMGMGKNFKYLKKINEELQIFDSAYKLPHPRWVMQYRLKDKTMYIGQYVDLLHQLKDQIG